MSVPLGYSILLWFIQQNSVWSFASSGKSQDSGLTAELLSLPVSYYWSFQRSDLVFSEVHFGLRFFLTPGVSRPEDFFGVHSDLAALMFWCLWNSVSVSILYFPAVLRLLFSGGLRKAHTDTEVQDAASSIWRAKAIMSAKPQGKKKLINTSPNNSFVRSCHNYILSAIALLKDLKTFPGLREPQIGHWIMEERGGKHLRLWGL